ncbi:MAG: serine hydrolase [Chlorobi bacterium]|nr:serine hydrolase [Chlorobiota bacterium]
MKPFFAVLIFLGISFSIFADNDIDSLFRLLSERERIGLLFISGGNFEKTDPSLNNTVKCISEDNSLQDYLVDLSEGVSNENFPVAFPSFKTLRYVHDTALVHNLMYAAARYYICKGAAGIFYKYFSGGRDSMPYHLIAGNPDNPVNIDIAYFDGLPLLKVMENETVLFPGSAEPDILQPGKPLNFTSGMPVASFQGFLEKGMLFYTGNKKQAVDKILKAIGLRLFDKEEIYRYAKRVLAVYSQSHVRSEECNPVLLKKNLLKYTWETVLSSFSTVGKRSDTGDSGSYLNINDQYSVVDLTNNYSDFSSRYKNPEKVFISLSANGIYNVDNKIVIIVSDVKLLEIPVLRFLAKNNELNIIFTGNPDDLKQIFPEIAGIINKILFIPWGTGMSASLIDQAMFGGIPLDGKVPYLNELIKYGFGKQSYPKIRIGYAFPEVTGAVSDSLMKIDSILNEIVSEKMSPGGQVMVVKNGYIIYNRPFGFLTYNKKIKVDENKLYDLASLTKIISTVPLVMKLYDEKMIILDSSLSTYLPELDTLETGKLTLRQVLLHEAGFPSYIPFHFDYIDKKAFKGSMYSGRYSRTYSIRLDRFFYFNKNVKYRKDVFSSKPDSLYNIRLSDNFYMNRNFKDSVLNRVMTVKLNKKKEYLYSDLGYFFLQRIIEKEYKQRLDSAFMSQFSKPLGLDRLLYLPLRRYSCNEIAPTGKDATFRREMICGYPNDKGAAMMGGVAGHAGLFGNACDIAVFSDMLLNKGIYGGKRYIKESTIEIFTSRQNGHNRRGLGFDKPETDPDKDTPASVFASPDSYGHSGYTGTFLWIDPEYELIYIFLSNRVYPDNYNRKLIKNNIRTRIQDIVYRSFLSRDEILQKKMLRQVGN